MSARKRTSTSQLNEETRLLFSEPVIHPQPPLHQQQGGRLQPPPQRQPQPRPPTQQQQFQQEETDWRTYCGVKIAIIVIILLFGIFQAVCSVKRWLVIHECNTTNNFTNDVLQDGYYHFIAALYGVFAILHAFATSSIVYDFKREVLEIPRNLNSNRKKDLQIKIFIVVAILAFLVLIGLSLAIVIIGFIYDFNQAHCNYHRYEEVLSGFYHVLKFFTTVIITIVLAFLMHTTVAVYHIWLVENDEFLVNENDDDDEYFKLLKNYYKMSSKYHSKGKNVMPLIKIYKRWFVLQWVIYFLSIFIDLTYVLRPWILTSGQSGVEIYKHHIMEYVYVALFTIYDFVVFIIPFACGLIMNYYHNEYCKKLAEQNVPQLCVNQPAEVDAAVKYALTTTILQVKKNEDYDFIPSILFIDIPLRSPGYILTIIISMVTLILSFLG